MTRMFTGGRSSGGGNPIFDKYEKRSAKDVFLKKMRGIDESKMTPEERYQKNFDKKLQELRDKALSGGGRYSFTLPGTEGEEKKLSKNMEAFIQRLAAKKAKEMEKKELERAQLKVTPKYFTGMQGGSIDKKGNIYGPDRRLIAKVNLKNGRMTSQAGMYLGKYNAQSPYTEHKIAQFIAKEYDPNKKNWMGGSANGGGGMGGFYGGGSDNKGGGFWG